MIKLFSTFNLVIPITLAMIITKVEPKIKKLLLFATDAKNDVIIDFSVSLILSSFSEEKILNKEGKRVNVTNNETISPRVIIQPKSIIGFMPLKINDKKAQMVVIIV